MNWSNFLIGGSNGDQNCDSPKEYVDWIGMVQLVQSWLKRHKSKSVYKW